MKRTVIITLTVLALIVGMTSSVSARGYHKHKPSPRLQSVATVNQIDHVVMSIRQPDIRYITVYGSGVVNLEVKATTGEAYFLHGIIPPYENSISFQVTTAREGDVNLDGCVTIGDATLIAQYKAGIASLTYGQQRTADTDDDGIVSMADAMHISQWLVDPDGTLGILSKPLWESPADNLKPIVVMGTAINGNYYSGKVTTQSVDYELCAHSSVIVPWGQYFIKVS